ncbi:thiamine phosphate synthase, partial [Clostridioides difficile]|uniref:thiamine phosphate synthase n=1 Tax=Clostridioides difficile TaxID=1496 RepID=UPI00163D50A0
EITKRYGVKFIINDRVDIALICDADGVHVGQSDIDVREVRKLKGGMGMLNILWRSMKWRFKNPISFVVTILQPFLWLVLYSS